MRCTRSGMSSSIASPIRSGRIASRDALPGWNAGQGRRSLGARLSGGLLPLLRTEADRIGRFLARFGIEDFVPNRDDRFEPLLHARRVHLRPIRGFRDERLTELAAEADHRVARLGLLVVPGG